MHGAAPALAAITATFNIFFVFLPSHLAVTGRAPLSRALGAAVVGLLLAVGVAPLAGRSRTGWVAGPSWSLGPSPYWCSPCR